MGCAVSAAGCWGPAGQPARPPASQPASRRSAAIAPSADRTRRPPARLPARRAQCSDALCGRCKKCDGNLPGSCVADEGAKCLTDGNVLGTCDAEGACQADPVTTCAPIINNPPPGVRRQLFFFFFFLRVFFYTSHGDAYGRRPMDGSRRT